MKAKAEIYESQTKDFIIFTNESLNVKDITPKMYIMDTDHIFPSANLCDSGSPSLETVPPFLKTNQPTKTALNISCMCREEIDQ